MNSSKFFLFIFVFLFFLTILPSKNTVWGQPVSFNTTISASMNASNTISFTAVFAPQAGTAKTIIIGRCLAANCATTQNMPTCPNGWSKNTGSTTDPWCRFSVTPTSNSYSSSVSMSGMPAGKYVILVSQNFNNTQKCSGNPNCTFNGGQVNCSGFSSCHPSADFVTFDVAAPTPTATPIRTPTRTPTAAPTVFITPTLNAAIILNSNVNNVIEYSATFSPLDYGRTGVYSNKEVIIGRCNNNDCSIVADSLICPSGFTKAAGNEKWCRRPAITDSLGNETPNPKVKVDMNGLSGGKYVILVSQSYRSQNNLFPEIKCSGNPTCTFNGGQVNCSGFSSCHPSADFVTFDVAAPTPTATPKPLSASINRARLDANNNATYDAIWNDDRGKKYIALTQCIGTTCNNHNSFARLANCPSPAQIGLTTSDSEVSNSTSKWCKYEITSHVSGIATQRKKTFTVNYSTFSNLLGPGKYIFAVNQEVDDNLKCSGNPACIVDNSGINSCGTPWSNCSRNDAVVLDVAAPTATPITPTATPIPTPTATATVAPITPTATVVTPTATNIPTATNTQAPTATVAPITPTATVAPITPTATVVTPTATLTPDTCPNFAKGNATCDPGGIIDNNDYNCWKANFLTAKSGATPTPAPGCSRVANFNSDAKVNLLDFAIWRIGYKSSISPTATTNP